MRISFGIWYKFVLRHPSLSKCFKMKYIYSNLHCRLKYLANWLGKSHFPQCIRLNLPYGSREFAKLTPESIEDESNVIFGNNDTFASECRLFPCIFPLRDCRLRRISIRLHVAGNEVKASSDGVFLFGLEDLDWRKLVEHVEKFYCFPWT